LWEVEAMGCGNGTQRWRELGGKEVGTGQLRTLPRTIAYVVYWDICSCRWYIECL